MCAPALRSGRRSTLGRTACDSLSKSPQAIQILTDTDPRGRLKRLFAMIAPVSLRSDRQTVGWLRTSIVDRKLSPEELPVELIVGSRAGGNWGEVRPVGEGAREAKPVGFLTRTCPY